MSDMDTVIKDQNNNYVPRKTWIVILLTFLQPGLGQVYNGQLKKGFFYLNSSVFIIIN